MTLSSSIERPPGPHSILPENLLISQYVMHHNPRYFSDPDLFYPDCWTKESFLGSAIFHLEVGSEGV